MPYARMPVSVLQERLARTEPDTHLLSLPPAERRALRSNAGASIRDWARVLGIPKTSFAYYESGARAINDSQRAVVYATCLTAAREWQTELDDFLRKAGDLFEALSSAGSAVAPW